MEEALYQHYIGGKILGNEAQYNKLIEYLGIGRAPYLQQMEQAVLSHGLDCEEVGRRYAHALFIEPLKLGIEDAQLRQAFEMLANAPVQEKHLDLKVAKAFAAYMRDAEPILDAVSDVRTIDHKDMMLTVFRDAPEGFFEAIGVSKSGFAADVAAALAAEKAAQSATEEGARTLSEAKAGVPSEARSFFKRLFYKPAPAEGVCMKKVSAVGLGAVVAAATLYYLFANKQDNAQTPPTR